MDSFRSVIMGVSGNGKSYHFKNKILPRLIKNKPVILFDMTGEYSAGIDLPKSIKKKEHAGIYSFFGNVEKNKGEISGFNVIQVNTANDYLQGLKFFLALKAPVTLVIEEARDVNKARDFKDGLEPLLKICRRGRHHGIDVLCITQRYGDVIPDLRSQFTGGISFYQGYAGDVDEMKKLWDNADKVKDLKKREFIELGEIPPELKAG